MKKSLTRIIALLLVPCLALSSVEGLAAASFSNPLSLGERVGVRGRSVQERFEQEALSAAARYFLHPQLTRLHRLLTRTRFQWPLRKEPAPVSHWQPADGLMPGFQFPSPSHIYSWQKPFYMAEAVAPTSSGAAGPSHLAQHMEAERLAMLRELPFARDRTDSLTELDQNIEDLYQDILPKLHQMQRNWETNQILLLIVSKLLQERRWAELEGFLDRIPDWHSGLLPLHFLTYAEALAQPDSDQVFESLSGPTNPMNSSLTESLGSRFFANAIKAIHAVKDKPFSPRALEEYVEASLQRIDPSEEWSDLGQLEGASGPLAAALWMLLHLRGQDMSYLPASSISGDLHFYSKDRQLYLDKVWMVQEGELKNHPVKEWLASRLGQRIGANAAHTEITNLHEKTLSKLYLLTNRGDLPQTSIQNAESANLVLNVLLRRWDMTKGMIQRSRVGDTFVEFDFDRGFDPDSIDLSRFFAKIEWQWQMGKSQEYWTESDFDPETIEQTIQRMETLDLDTFADSLRPQLPEHPEYRRDFEDFITFLRQTRTTLRHDVEVTQRALLRQRPGGWLPGGLGTFVPVILAAVLGAGVVGYAGYELWSLAHHAAQMTLNLQGLDPNLPVSYSGVGAVATVVARWLRVDRWIKKLLPARYVKGLLFWPRINFVQGQPLDKSLIKTRPDAAEHALALIEDAYKRGIELSITGHLRGVDGPGSSLDLPEFQVALTPAGAKRLKKLPSTPTIASDFSVKLRFERATGTFINEYVAEDYGLTKDNPLTLRADHDFPTRVVESKTFDKVKQAEAVGYIFQLFGLRGIRVSLDSIDPMALAGGMESSNAFNVALIAAASMLSGANLSQADIFNLAVKLENDEFGGLTGGQGHLSTMLGGAYRHVWLSGVKDENGRLINPYAAFSAQLLSPDESEAIENHMLLVQAGKNYENGIPTDPRTAGLINAMWTDLLRDKDEIALPLHQSKLALAERYTEALKNKDFTAAAKIIHRYVEIRDQITRRWLDLLIRVDAQHREPGGLRNYPEYAEAYWQKVFNPDHPFYEEFEQLRAKYEHYGEGLRNISLYSEDPIGSLVAKAWEQGIAIMPLGAGGPGANLIAVDPKGTEHLKAFLQEQGLGELTSETARAIVRGTGELKGYMPFKVGKEPLQIAGFDKLDGVHPPDGPVEAVYDQKTGQIKPVTQPAAKAYREFVPRITVAEDAEHVGILAAHEVAAPFLNEPGHREVLGLPTDRTSIPMYNELDRMHRDEGLDLSNARTYPLDDFVGLERGHPASFQTRQERNLDALEIPAENRDYLNGLAADLKAEGRRYDQAIEDAGGLDTVILGISDKAHVAFMEPGSTLETPTGPVTLLYESRVANAGAFGGDVSLVPEQALSISIATILKAKRIILLASTPEKAEAIHKMLNGPISPDVPASFLRLHPNVHIIVTPAAFRLALQANPSLSHTKVARAAPALWGMERIRSILKWIMERIHRGGPGGSNGISASTDTSAAKPSPRGNPTSQERRSLKLLHKAA